MAVIPTNPSQNSDPNVDDILKQTQPAKSGGFKRVMSGIGKVAATTAANILLPGIGGALGGGISAQLLGAAMPSLGTDVTQYLAMQNQLQQEQIAFEMATTVLKIRGDSSMAAIRNMELK
jgi:hypothetical protein